VQVRQRDHGVPPGTPARVIQNNAQYAHRGIVRFGYSFLTQMETLHEHTVPHHSLQEKTLILQTLWSLQLCSHMPMNFSELDEREGRILVLALRCVCTICRETVTTVLLYRTLRHMLVKFTVINLSILKGPVSPAARGPPTIPMYYMIRCTFLQISRNQRKEKWSLFHMRVLLCNIPGVIYFYSRHNLCPPLTSSHRQLQKPAR